ncbi:MAG: hypothetical protein ACLQVK_00835 [Acidimicrobiales bacterium]
MLVPDSSWYNFVETDAPPSPVACQVVTEPPFRLTIEVPSWSRLGRALLDVGAAGAFIYAVSAGAWELWRDR